MTDAQMLWRTLYKDDGVMVIYCGDEERMRVDPDGSVKIGDVVMTRRDVFVLKPDTAP